MSALAAHSKLLDTFPYLKVKKTSIHETYAGMAPMGQVLTVWCTYGVVYLLCGVRTVWCTYCVV